MEEYLKNPFGDVLLMRHALAPGGGDPAGFNLEVCSTQRNLNGEGQEQSKSLGLKMGDAFKAAGVELRKPIYTSQWCRCKDTATLLAQSFATAAGIDAALPVEEEWGLNSFYQPSLGWSRDQCVGRLNAHLLANLAADQRRSEGNGKLAQTLLVTHYVTVNAVGGIAVSSGGVVAYNTKTKQSRELSI